MKSEKLPRTNSFGIIRGKQLKNQNWKKVKLGEVADLNPTVRLKKGESYSFIPMEIIDGANKYIEPNSKKRFDGGGTKFSEGDVLFARITPCLEHGKVAVAKGLEEGVGFGSTEYFIFRGKENITNTDFLYYISKINKFKQTAINSMVGVSGRQRARIEAIQNYELNLPTITEQKRIADILSAFDDKIELNNKINQNLEQMAQAIFKEWFVNSEKLKVKSEKLKRWEAGYLEDGICSEIIKPGVKKFAGEKIYLATADVVKNEIVNNKIKITYNNRPIRANSEPVMNSIWFAKMINTYKVLFFFEGNKDDIDKYVLSTGFMGIKALRSLHYYLYFFINSQKFHQLKDTLVQGAVQEAITNTNVKEIKLAIPPEKLILLFNKKVEPMIKIIFKNKQENQTLSSLRDLFLPKLMNGEIIVNSE